jgi:outer membrane lipoprotein-sorting protein
MNDLDAALALLLDARNRYSTVRAVIRNVFSPLPGAAEGEGEHAVTREEYVTRIWLATPDRLRVETAEDGTGWSIGIRVGAIWWAVDSDGSRHSNVHEPEVGSDSGDSTKLLFDPAPLVGALKLELVQETELLGRRVIRMRGTRRSNVLTTDFELDELEPQDELELDVDAERGVLLRRRSEHLGHEWFVQEAVDIAFDEEFDPQTFVFSPTEGRHLTS